MDVNKSGTLTDEQVFGGQVPAVCPGHLPLDVQQELAERDAVKYTVCPARTVPCSALNEHTGECLSEVCCFDLQEHAMEAM